MIIFRAAWNVENVRLNSMYGTDKIAAPADDSEDGSGEIRLCTDLETAAATAHPCWRARVEKLLFTRPTSHDIMQHLCALTIL